MSTESITSFTHYIGIAFAPYVTSISTPTIKQARISQYRSEEGLARLPLPVFSPITVTVDTTDPQVPIYTVTFNDLQGIVPLTITIKITPTENTITKLNALRIGADVEIINSDIILTVRLPILKGVDPNRYNVGDEYRIILNAVVNNVEGVFVRASRSKSEFIGAGGGFTSIPIAPTGPTGTIGIQPVRVPIIDIYGQTTLNGEYLSDMTFVIQDQYKYYCNENIIDPCQCDCDIIYIQPDKLKTTTLIDNNIPLQDVVIGKGKTLQAKVDKIATSIGEPNFKLFNERFLRYAMLKYILIRLLYGTYDLNKLCRNYNKQFFKDLKHSRFCGFIEFFEDPANEIMNFDQYFIKCKQC